MPAPFLLLTARPEDDAAAAEYEAVLAATGLPASALRQVRLDREQLGTALEGIAGVIVGGSPFNVTDAEKPAAQHSVEADLARLARTAVDEDLPTMFTCYGIGVAAVALGGTVDHEHGEAVGSVEVALTPDGILDPLFGRLPERFDVFVGHKESVGRLPEGSVLLAGSAGCPVQAFRVGRGLYATQFHPEPTARQLADRARIYQHHGYFAASEMAIVEERIAASSVTEPRALLSGFVELFGRPFVE